MLMFRADRRLRARDQGAGADRVLDHVERSGAAEGDGSARGLRRAAPHRLVRVAARLQLQPRRHHVYLSMASIFVAQAAGVELSTGQQIGMMLMLMLTSKGVAGVPRAALVILAATVASYNLPLEGVTLVLGVDALMDMGRTATNVIGNCLASVVVAKWEGELPPRRARPVLLPQIHKECNQERVGEVDEERADERHHQERFRRRAVAFHQRPHVRHRVGGGAEHEAGKAARHHRRIVIAAHHPRHHPHTDHRDQRHLRGEDDQQRDHQANSSHKRSVISAMTRNSDNAMLPMSSMIRIDNPIAPVTSSRLRITAATSMAPM